jgi:pimeloyl-ACP methyl ester carboxylesterase
MQQFFAESPMPVEHHSYKALEIFWKYNFFERRKRSIDRNIPTLVISGGQDVTFSFEMGEALKSHFTPSDHLHLPEAGHVVMAEYPEIVNQAIATWLNSLSAQADLEQGTNHDQTVF